MIHVDMDLKYENKMLEGTKESEVEGDGSEADESQLIWTFRVEEIVHYSLDNDLVESNDNFGSDRELRQKEEAIRQCLILHAHSILLSSLV